MFKILVYVILIFVLSGNILFAGIHSRVDELIKKEKFTEAEEIARKAVESSPKDVEALCALACVYRNMASESRIKLDFAALGLKEGEEGKTTLTEENIKKGISEKRTYKKDIFSKAEKLYYQIIDIDKTYENAYYNLKNSYYDLNDFENYFKVIGLFIRNLKDKEDTKGILLDMAAGFFKEDDFVHARRFYELIVKEFPDYLDARSDLGAVYFVTGDIRGANKIAMEVEKKNPKDTINLKNLINSYIALEMFDKAYATAVKVIDLEKDQPYNYYVAGILACAVDKDPSVFTSKFVEILKNDEENKVFVNIAKELPDLKKKKREEKLKFLYNIMYESYKGGLKFDALVFAHIYAKEGLDGNVLNILGAIYDRMQFSEKGIETLKKIEEFRKLDPKIMPEYSLNSNFGKNYFIAKDFDSSIKYYLKNFEQRKNDAVVNYMLGRCYVMKGNKEEARKYLELNKKMDDKNQLEFINAAITLLKEIEGK